MTEKKGFPLRLDPEIYDALQRWASSRVPQRQRADRISAAVRAAGRRTSARIGSRRIRRPPVQRRSAIDSSGCRRRFSQATPRDVRVNTSGGSCSSWRWRSRGRRSGAASFSARAPKSPDATSTLFASERIVTAGDVIRLRKRGDGDDHRITAHYRYTARGRELTGETRLRRDERERYVVGSPVAVWYLASDPEMSWLDGYAPRPQPGWPATVVPLACGVSALALIQAVRRQSNLLAYGRPAMATVTKVEKKNTGRGPSGWCTTSGPR